MEADESVSMSPALSDSYKFIGAAVGVSLIVLPLGILLGFPRMATWLSCLGGFVCLAQLPKGIRVWRSTPQNRSRLMLATLIAGGVLAVLPILIVMMYVSILMDGGFVSH